MPFTHRALPPAPVEFSMQDVQRRIAAPWWLILYGVFAFWTYELAFFVLLRPSMAESGEFRASDPVTRTANIAVLAGLLVFGARQPGFLRALRRHAKLPAFVVLYCLCSASWSLDPVTSARRAVSLATCFAFGTFALLAYGPRGVVRLYAWSLFLAALASWLALPIVPGKVYDNDGLISLQAVRSFHGVFTQKNELSVEMLMGVCCWAYLGIVERRPGELERRIWPVAMFAILAAMVYAKGTTSLLAALLVAAVVVRMRWRSWRVGLVLHFLIGSAALALIAVVVAEPDLLFSALGKEPNMTGRLPLWIESAQAVMERPILGWGYNAFWGVDSVPARYIWQRIGWPAPNAHNGLLQLGLDLGLVGGLIYLAMLLGLARRVLGAVGHPGFPEARYLALLLVAMFVESLDEGTTGWPDVLSILTAVGYVATSIWRAGAWPAPLPSLRERSKPHASGTKVRKPAWLPE